MDVLLQKTAWSKSPWKIPPVQDPVLKQGGNEGGTYVVSGMLGSLMQSLQLPTQ